VARFLDNETFDSRTTKDYLSKFISGAKDQCAEGKAAWLANILGVNKSAVHGWMTGKNVAEFSRVVSIAYNLRCEISDIFKADSTELLPLPIPPRTWQKGGGRPFDRSELDRRLEDFLKQSESLSVKKVASLLGVSPRALYIYSNELAKKISARHGAVLYEQATASVMVKKNILRTEIRAMLGEGIFPTRRRIAKRVGMRALTLFRPEDKLLFKQVLNEERTRQGAARQKETENDKASHNEKEP
jgi:predicted transcriptional regulator